MKIDIKSSEKEQIEENLAKAGFKSYRAAQVWGWLQKGVTDFAQMTNIPAELINYLKENYYISVINIEKKLISGYDSTVKYLFSLHDGFFIESVVMRYKHGNTICISTQAGCKMNCAFCATGKNGFKRNLTPAEMLLQIEIANKDLFGAGTLDTSSKTKTDGHEHINNVVLMGMGEPLDNFDNVIKFFKLINGKIGMRHISLSTCGVVPKIYELAEYKFGLTLSVSLHAPNDALRSRTMPINNTYPIADLLRACRHYAKVTGRRISFEYALIEGVNDSDECATELAQKLRGMLCHVN
jgi:23S rRNA (adenine2503-C2)-methyltransferase